MKRVTYSIALLFLLPQMLLAQLKPLSDSSFVSLLTYSANEEVHAMFGHTAIRVCDSTQNFDTVFNYGVFDFTSKNFIYRFVKGETDYILAAMRFSDSMFDSAMRNLSMREQVLNMTLEERQRLLDLLIINLQPNNRSYRYSFLFDNCATRPLSIIVKAIDGTVELPRKTLSTTFRHLLNDCTAPYPWVTFGIDLVLGGRIDEPLQMYEELFLPVYLHARLNATTLTTAEGVTSKLVLSDTDILEAEPLDDEPFPVSPTVAGVMLLAVVVGVSLCGYRRRRLWRGFDVMLFVLYGLGGAIIFFLVFVSEHPAVSPNWNAVWLHPFYLLFAILLYLPAMKGRLAWIYGANVVAIALFYAIKLCTIQQFNPNLDLIVLPLWLRSAEQLLLLARQAGAMKK